MTEVDMVKFCKNFVSLIDDPTATGRDMIDIIENGKTYAVEYNTTEHFLWSDKSLKELYKQDTVYCKVYAFIRDNQNLFIN